MGMEGNWGNYPPRAKALRTTADLHLTWDVPFEPGMLKAVGVKDGEVVSTVEISTTGEPAAISLTADRDALTADRRDVAHLAVQILDAQGRLMPIADNEITFAVEGEATLIGVDNGNPQSHEDYKSNRRKAFNGLALAILQSTAKPGIVRVTASSPSLQSATVNLTTKA